MRSKAESKLANRLPAIFVVGVLALGVAMIAWRLVAPGDEGDTGAFKMPELSDVAARGEVAFDANCASCHGANALGSEKGPPLIHDIYNPGHHADGAFVGAAKQGVPQHHWRFGDMPPQRQVSDEHLAAIIRYVRELQEANGIFYRPHTM